jgi:hypothetical protein
MLDDDDPRDAWLMTADTLVHLNLRCVVEVREEEYWEPRLLIFHDDLGAIEASVADFRTVVGSEARLAGYTRDLRRADGAPTAQLP